MKTTKRLVSLFLAVVLVLSVFPVSALVTGAQATAEDFYKFDLPNQFPEGGFSTATTGLKDQHDLIKQYYDEGKIGWMIEGWGNGSSDTKGQTPKDNSFTQTKFSKGVGIQINTSGYFWWVALRIKAPGTGTYDLTVNTATVTSSGDQKHSAWTEAYFFAADKITGSTGINDLLTLKNKLANFAPTVENPDAFLGNVSMQAGKEYIVVLRNTYDVFTSVGKDTRTANLYLKGLTFVAAAPPPVDTSKVTFDFDLADKKTALFSNNTYIKDVADTLDSYYKDEFLNWTLAEDAASSTRFRSSGGLTTYGKQDEYIAFRIKFPGSGLYTLSLNHGQMGRGATGAVYILPGDTTDIAFAMDNHNRVGKVQFYNENGDTAITDNVTSVIGTWEFSANKEYILVVEAYEGSPFFEQGYMYVSQLICEKGDKTSSAGAAKPHSVVVDPSPVKLLEVCTYNAAAEINGDDYLFLPLEGHKMAVYNLDKGTLVDYTDTSFGQVKGMAVDDEGILWMVGDNPNIFRYDPYVNAGQVVCRFKNFSDVESPNLVKGAETSFGMATGDDGCIYFGVSKVGVLAKYNTRTGVFTNMGKIGDIEDANAYASAPCYKDGIVYITTMGDRDSDGTKTVCLAKFDAVTGERLLVKDVTQYFSQNEVMVRGMNICGGVLIAGGEKNDVKQVAAFDAETFEFIDLGVDASAFYGPTAELGGKVWFGTAKGIYEFDSATRKATPVKGLDSISVSLRNGVDCFVTIEGNDLFPGKSIVNFRTNTGNPAIYNTTTGRFMQLEGIVDPQYGSTSDIRPIVKVPGDNPYLYMGSFNTEYCSIYDVEQGKIIQNFETMGQTDAILVYDGKLYVGNYNRGVVTQINLDDANRNVPLLSLKTEYKQSRILALAAGDGMVFAGSVPDAYEIGGCLAVIDLDELENTYAVRHVVENQSVISLAYHGGYVIGGTSINPGTGGVTPPAGTSAKFFIYDPVNKEKKGEYDLRDSFPEVLPKNEILVEISGLTVDENGKVWMVAGGCLFTFTLDANGKVKNLRLERDFGRDMTGDWWPTAMVIKDGYLYANFGKIGGVQKVKMSNPSVSERIPIPVTDYIAIGSDDNIYYTQGKAALYMYPVAITDADRQAAAAMDAAFVPLKNNTTLESEADIKAARAAYEALSWTQKGLVQNLDILVAAEIDLLECKIDAIGEVTLDEQAAIYALKAEYQALSVKNKTYVKNYYTVFVPAMQELQGIIDENEAARVQALINTIPGMGQITLEKEEAIREIETQYNAMTKQQKALLTNAKPLLDALATIRKLRDEKIDCLNQLIAGIGEVTLEDEATIAEAKEIFAILTNVEREKVDYKTLNAAEAALKKLQQTKAAEVDALILAIGESIDHSSKDAIEAARKAYDALSPGAQKLVKNLAILTEAEAIFAELGMNPKTIILIVAIAGGAVLAAAAVVVILLVLKKKKATAQEASEETEETPAEPEA